MFTELEIDIGLNFSIQTSKEFAIFNKTGQIRNPRGFGNKTIPIPIFNIPAFYVQLVGELKYELSITAEASAKVTFPVSIRGVRKTGAQWLLRDSANPIPGVALLKATYFDAKNNVPLGIHVGETEYESGCKVELIAKVPADIRAILGAGPFPIPK